MKIAYINSKLGTNVHQRVFEIKASLQTMKLPRILDTVTGQCRHFFGCC